MIASQSPTTLRYRLEQDDSPSDPRKEWDHFATMVCSHRNYELGDRGPDEQETEALERGGFALLERYLRRFHGVVYLAPLSLLDHSGLHIWIGGGSHWSDSAGWDSGTVGFISVTREQLKAAGFEPGDTVDGENAATMIARQEVEEYDQYLTGDVWGFIIEQVPACSLEDCDDAGEPGDDSWRGQCCHCACHEPGEHVDSCWGFYGHEYAEQEAKEALASAQADARFEAEKYGVTC